MIVLWDPARGDLLRDRLRAAPAGGLPVATIGFFDGFHRGHRRVIEELRALASRSGGAPAVITFERHPIEVLRGGTFPTLTPIRHRLLLLARAGVEAVVVLRFDADLASWPPETFVERIVRGALGAREVLLGFDSAFGKGRQGTFEYLKAREETLGIVLRQAGVLREGETRISSTLVREAARAGDLRRLEVLLGRPYSVLGEVVRGDGRGSRLGFPTANLALGTEVLPPAGVYFAEASLIPRSAAPGPLEVVPAAGDPRRPAIVNLGYRPTFAGGGPTFAGGGPTFAGGGPTFARSGQQGGDPVSKTAEGSKPLQPLLEVHLLDFAGDLYGIPIEVHFLERHREERKFSGPEELRGQIARDLEARRSYRP